MVQVALAYIAMAVGLLLLAAGTFALTTGAPERMLSPHRRRIVTGGIAGMILFLIASLVWLRGSLWLD